MPRVREQRGQAAVELVALVPVVAVLAFAAWQVVVAGHAAWVASAAARAAARAVAVGGDPRAAARAALPASLEPGLRVSTTGDGRATVAVGVPLVVGHGRLLTLTDRARFAPQAP
jgi:Flp pilus assembly protein TadG